MMTKHQIRVCGNFKTNPYDGNPTRHWNIPQAKCGCLLFFVMFLYQMQPHFFKCKTSCWLAIFPQDWMKIRSDQKVGATWGVPGFELLVLWFYLVLHLMKAALSVWECHDLVPQKTEFRGRSLAKMVATCRITILCITCLGFKHIEETDCDG